MKPIKEGTQMLHVRSCFLYIIKPVFTHYFKQQAEIQLVLLVRSVLLV